MDAKITTMINSLQHVGIPVSDIAVSEAFYSQFGFRKVMQSTFMVEDESGTCIMMKYREIILELYQMPAKQMPEIKIRKDGHIDHIAFDVDDIDHAFELVKKASFHVMEEKPVLLESFWNRGCKYFNIIGPDGERLELNQIIKKTA